MRLFRSARHGWGPPGRLRMAIWDARAVAARPLGQRSFPTYTMRKDEGTLISKLHEGGGVAVVEGLPPVPFGRWLREYDSFRADPGLAEKGLVKFSENKEHLGRTLGSDASAAEQRTIFDVKYGILEDKTPHFAFFREQYAVMSDILMPVLLKELAEHAGDSDLASSALSQSILRHNFYPAQVGSCGAHTDYGLVTVIQGSAVGLQMLEGGEWRSLPPVEGHFAFAGDMLECLTAGAIRAVVHRVVLDDDDAQSVSTATPSRQSGLFFLQPCEGDVVRPSAALRQCLGAEGPVGAGYKPVRYGDWHEAKKHLAFK